MRGVDIDMRNAFYTTDAAIEGIMDDLAGLLRQWGLKGTSSDVIKYALHYTAEGHGLKKRTPGRTIAKPARKDGDDGEKHDG